jgi:hypothetical protein
VELRSTISCPYCSHSQTLTMAEDSCLVAYDCPACGARLTPNPGDCCVFCSYGDVPCPPVQKNGDVAPR